MSENPATNIQPGAFVPFAASRSRKATAKARPTPSTKLSMKRSLVACAFLIIYVAAYFGVGFAGVTLIERAWSAIFR